MCSYTYTIPCEIVENQIVEKIKKLANEIKAEKLSL